MASCAVCLVEDDEHILYQVGSESPGMPVLLGFGLRTIKQNSGRAGYASVGRQPAGSAGRRVSLLANRAEGACAVLLVRHLLGYSTLLWLRSSRKDW